MADKRKPWMKWFYRDWRANLKLRMCSFGARGLWADLISLMAESRCFGFLLVDDMAPTAKQLVGLIGGTEREISTLRAELGKSNVFSVTGLEMPDDVRALVPADMPDGVILSRRMVRDKAKADKDRANGKGGGNPSLKPPDNDGVNPQANPQRLEVRGEAPTGLHPHEDQASSPVAARAEPEGAHTHDTTSVIAELGARKRA